jgi:hypothetical protein
VLEERVNDALIASYLYGLDLIGQERGMRIRIIWLMGWVVREG